MEAGVCGLGLGNSGKQHQEEKENISLDGQRIQAVFNTFQQSVPNISFEEFKGKYSTRILRYFSQVDGSGDRRSIAVIRDSIDFLKNSLTKLPDEIQNILAHNEEKFEDSAVRKTSCTSEPAEEEKFPDSVKVTEIANIIIVLHRGELKEPVQSTFTKKPLGTRDFTEKSSGELFQITQGSLPKIPTSSDSHLPTPPSSSSNIQLPSDTDVHRISQGSEPS